MKSVLLLILVVMAGGVIWRNFMASRDKRLSAKVLKETVIAGAIAFLIIIPLLFLQGTMSIKLF